MSVTAIKIAAVNVYCRSNILYAILQTSDSHILLVQEPWFHHIQTACSDLDPAGISVNGVTLNRKWEIFLPPHSPPNVCKVVAYICSDPVHSATIVNNTSHPIASPSSMVLDLHYDEEFFRLVNIYHCVLKRGHALHHITSSSLDPLIPTMVFGDFNTHSHLWSIPNTTPSLPLGKPPCQLGDGSGS